MEGQKIQPTDKRSKKKKEKNPLSGQPLPRPAFSVVYSTRAVGKPLDRSRLEYLSPVSSSNFFKLGDHGFLL